MACETVSCEDDIITEERYDTLKLRVCSAAGKLSRLHKFTFWTVLFVIKLKWIEKRTAVDVM